jgi:hypothetical protein
MQTYDTTALSANLVKGPHPLCMAISASEFKALSKSPEKEKGCFAGTFRIWLDIEESLTGGKCCQLGCSALRNLGYK